jgi:diadenosine tetraphosphate (Ap4A) HIT family hydrolase
MSFSWLTRWFLRYIDLDRLQRAEYLGDMALVGDALLEVTGAYRINYGIMGNSDPFRHAHIVPRYSAEPENLRNGLPWSYPKKLMDAVSLKQSCAR